MSKYVKPKSLTVGDEVYHDFSRLKGEVIRLREDPYGYNYLIRWYDNPTYTDWYNLSSILLWKEQSS